MAKISELVSQYVISLYNGKIEGVVENILFNLETGRAKYLVVYNYNDEATYVLPISKIYSLGDGAITIRNSSALNLYESRELEVIELCNPVNNSVFKISGDMLGVVSDLELDDKFYITHYIINNDIELNKNMIASFNHQTVIVYDENSKINIKNFYDKTKIKPTGADTRIVNILQIKENGKSTVAEGSSGEITQLSTAKTVIPNRAIANYNFLINRKVNKNILSQNGDLIIKQNTRISASTINLARLNGKLSELTKFSG